METVELKHTIYERKKKTLDAFKSKLKMAERINKLEDK